MGMRRINTRGIKLANKGMIAAAIAYNIKKMMKFKTPKALSRMMELPFITDYFFDNSHSNREVKI